MEAEGQDEDAVMMEAIEVGAEDFQAEGEIFEISTAPEDFNSVVAALEKLGYSFLEAGVRLVPQTYVALTEEKDIKNMTKMIELLEDNDDVQNVYHNWE